MLRNGYDEEYWENEDPDDEEQDDQFNYGMQNC